MKGLNILHLDFFKFEVLFTLEEKNVQFDILDWFFPNFIKSLKGIGLDEIKISF